MRLGLLRAAVAVGVGAVLPVALTERLAHADSKEAAHLFDQGLAEMQAHRYPTGCPALEESYRLEPHPGVLITLAECEYQWGNLKQAEQLFTSFVALAEHMNGAEARSQGERKKLASDRLAALQTEIPVVTLVLGPNVVPGSTVSLDNDAATPSGTTRRVDPGKHTARLLAPDGSTATTTDVTLAKGEKRTVRVEGAAPVAPIEPPPEPASHSPWFYTAAVVGGAGIVVGAILGGVALSDKSSITAHCPTASTCDSPSAASSANSAVTIGWASTGAFAVGLAGAGAAVTLWILEPKKSGGGVALSPVLVPPSAHSYGSMGARLQF